MRSIDRVCSGMAELANEDVTRWSDEQVRAGLSDLLVVSNQVMAVLALLVGSFDARGLSDDDGFRTTRSWLTAFGRLSQGAASGVLSRARLLRELPALGSAALAGAVSAEHLHKVEQLVHRVGVDGMRRFDVDLATLATQAAPADVQKACERIADHLDPDGKPPADSDFDKRELSLTPVGSMVYIKGRLDPEGGAAVRTALDAIMKPPGPHDARTAGQRRADALIHLCRAALIAGQLPTVGGVRPQIGILVSARTLLGTAEADDKPAWLHGVGEIPPELAQRIACDASVWRLVLDPANGLPLELGRTVRVVPPWLRKALEARDRGCRWPGCTAPAAWCDVHHYVPWYHGGTTDGRTCLLLCRYHHSKVHEGQWRLDWDYHSGAVKVYRPDGSPYEIAQTWPYTTPTKRAGPDAA
jgi:hypothetical protein